MRRNIHITIIACLLALAVFTRLPVEETLAATLTATSTPEDAVQSVYFEAKVDFTVGTGPTGNDIGDLDGDDKPDLAVSNYGNLGNGSTVSVLRNTGTAGNVSFAAKIDFTVGSGPHGVAIGDLDGDGKLDLVTANYASAGSGNTVSVLRNTSTIGNLSFGTKVDFSTGSGPVHVEIGDLDGDGKADLVVTNFGDGNGSTLSVLRNSSTIGNLSFEPKVDFSTGAGPYGIAIGDIDGDGMADLAVADFGTFTTPINTVSVLRNTSTSGTVSFAPKADFTTGSGPRFVVIDDLDGDGKPDLAVSNFGMGGSGTTLSVLRNTSTSGNVSFASKLDLTAGTGALGIAGGDLNEDGKPDLAVTNYGTTWPLPTNLGATVSVFENTSTVGSIAFSAKLDFGTGTGPHYLAIDDLDSDNRPDLALVNHGSGDGNTTSVLRNTIDEIPPSVTVTSSASTPTKTSPIPLTITFSEAVTGFVVGDLSVGNGTAGNFSGSGAAYTVNITPGADGLVTVDIAAGVAADAAGNGNTAAAQFSITYDGTPPVVTMTSPAPNPTNTAPIPLTITFSEAVTGFGVGDLSVGNGTAGSFSGSGAAYTVNITPGATGPVTVDIAAGVATDAAGNGNTAAARFSITYDGTPPAVTITSSAPNPTHIAPIPLTISFSEAVTGFVVGDLSIGNGTARNFGGSGATYTVNIVPNLNGQVTVDIAAGVAADAAGNGNTAAAQFSITYNGNAPKVTITSPVASPTNTSPIPVTITFSEAVAGFVSGDLTITNGTAGGFSGADDVYTAFITPSADGFVTVDIEAGVAFDEAGNGNTAAAQYSITYDTTAPTAAMNPLPHKLPRTSTISWSGSDALAGIAYFVVQVQQDGGNWTDWKSKTTATSAQFIGEFNTLYAFRVRAVDHAGNAGAWSLPVETRVSSGIYVPMVRRSP